MVKTDFQFIRFSKLAPKPGTSTDIWACVNKHHVAQIGIVKWYAPWRQYCFFLNEERSLACYGVVLSAGCMENIAEFCKSLMAERRIKA